MPEKVFSMDMYRIIAEYTADPARRSRAFGRFARLAACAAALAIAAAAPRVLAGELVTGGDFETGTFPAGWVHGAGTLNGGSNPDWADNDVVLETTYNGSYCAILGFKDTSPKRDRVGYMYYPVTVPADISSAGLNVRFRVQGFDGGGNDPFIVTIRDAAGNVLETVVQYDFAQRSAQFKDSGWISDDGTGPAGFDMSAYAGQTVYLDFRQYNLNDNQY